MFPDTQRVVVELRFDQLNSFLAFDFAEQEHELFKVSQLPHELILRLLARALLTDHVRCWCRLA